jgi:hypothetical protein
LDTFLGPIAQHGVHQIGLGIQWGQSWSNALVHQFPLTDFARYQPKFTHVYVAVAVFISCYLLYALFLFAVTQGVWGHQKGPIGEWFPSYGGSGLLCFTSRGISWGRIRFRHLRRLQEDPTSNVPALRGGSNSLFEDYDHVCEHASNLVLAGLIGQYWPGMCIAALGFLLRLVAHPWQLPLAGPGMFLLSTFLTRTYWMPTVSYYVPLLISYWVRTAPHVTHWWEQLDPLIQYPRAMWTLAHLCPGIPGLPVPATAAQLWVGIGVTTLAYRLGRAAWRTWMPPTYQLPDWAKASWQWILDRTPVWSFAMQQQIADAIPWSHLQQCCYWGHGLQCSTSATRSVQWANTFSSCHLIG